MNMILDRACLFLNRELHEIPEIREIIVNPNFTGVPLENDDMGMAMNIRQGSCRDNYSIKEIVKDKTVAIVGFGGNVTKISSRAARVYVMEPERFFSESGQELFIQKNKS